ncbi:uncharacterized protein HD556DRAFT_1445184 [Suillus plorans]|uniref:Crinkler effector protein N-terminal domain-containing protein n=1 Tax=Suillus plorans TaxID=116603 RepID=A0A9P7ADQ9_9AGAM|nr:uncharacterized protein HD556DRAFT_1313550 [Suillus plorans]XP_041158363.1 uncharacterized protein HD556DRAFT_1445184 [Suillus plorans]KAG1786298.1 hypothetical protein HD556DRAFT_1313550 [Suillus plorans]KAG1791557.1 hypothetical protein HD556DRAFT_1445184 [Suillus plorans]
MISKFNLNCLVLGDHPRNIFPVKISSTKIVGNLKDLIKEKNKHKFDAADAKDLELWKVDLLLDDTFERNLNELQLDHKKSLSPVDEMLKVFDSPPQPMHLHILVQPLLPAGIPHQAGHLLINLNCLVFGDHPWYIFPIKIVSTEIVGDLKNLIKEKNKHEFDAVDAKDLELWKVDLPVDDNFERNLKIVNELELSHKQSLSPVDGMFEVFDSPPRHKHLHIIIAYIL